MKVDWMEANFKCPLCGSGRVRYIYDEETMEVTFADCLMCPYTEHYPTCETCKIESTCTRHKS